MNETSAPLSSEAAGPSRDVAQAMHWGLVSCSSDTSLREVAALMADARVHCVVVIDDPIDAQPLWGVVSDLDLVAAATVRPLGEQCARGTAMRPAVTAFPHEPLGAAAERMTKHGISHLVVVDPLRRRPVGVLSTLDLAQALAEAVPG
jgi:CBS domain-containing protein